MKNAPFPPAAGKSRLPRRLAGLALALLLLFPAAAPALQAAGEEPVEPVQATLSEEELAAEAAAAAALSLASE